MNNVLIILLSMSLGIIFGILISYFLFGKKLLKEVFASQFKDTSEDVVKNLIASESREDSLVKGAVKEIEKNIKDEVQKLSENLTNASTTWKINTENLTKEVGGLSKSHAKWSAALSNNSLRGSFAEESLKKMLSDTGFVKGVNYFSQEKTKGDEQDLIPDIVIKTVEGGSIIIDSKAPLKAYIEAIDEENPKRKNELMKEHAKSVMRHVNELSKKDYSAYNLGSPDFVIMWLDNVSAFTSALEAMPDLVEKAASKKVLVCPPSLVFACLKTIQLSFAQQKISGNAMQVIELGAELHQRAVKFTKYFSSINDSLDRAGDQLQKSMSSWNRRMMPTLRKFQEFSGIPEKDRLSNFATQELISTEDDKELE